MVSLFRQDATGGYPKGKYLMDAMDETITVETVAVDVVQCPSCDLFAEIRLDDRGKVRPCPSCGTSLRTIVKGVKLDRIYWR